RQVELAELRLYITRRGSERYRRGMRMALAFQRSHVRGESGGIGTTHLNLGSRFFNSRSASVIVILSEAKDLMVKESNARALLESDIDPNPLAQFRRWYDEALRAGLVEPTAMTLATASRGGVPSARMVLLKGYDERGFVFFTNYASAKGRDLKENPQAALLFWWGPLERQIRITGQVERVPDSESDAYFLTRPIGSRLGAIVSNQS